METVIFRYLVLTSATSTAQPSIYGIQLFRGTKTNVEGRAALTAGFFHFTTHRHGLPVTWFNVQIIVKPTTNDKIDKSAAIRTNQLMVVFTLCGGIVNKLGGNGLEQVQCVKGIH